MNEPTKRRAPAPSTIEDAFFTISELARRWKCSEKKITRLIKAKKLITHRFEAQVRIALADALTYERLHREA